MKRDYYKINCPLCNRILRSRVQLSKHFGILRFNHKLKREEKLLLISLWASPIRFKCAKVLDFKCKCGVQMNFSYSENTDKTKNNYVSLMFFEKSKLLYEISFDDELDEYGHVTIFPMHFTKMHFFPKSINELKAALMFY